MAKNTKSTKPVLTEKEANLRKSANAKQDAAEMVFLTIEELKAAQDKDWNPGQRQDGDELGLIESIRYEGLREAPRVSVHKDGSKLLLQGNRRTDACYAIWQEDPKLFASLFPKGIKVQLIKDLTPDEEYYIACDHGQVMPRRRQSVIEQGIKMFRSGATEKMVLISMWDEINTVFSALSPKALAELQAANRLEDKTARSKARMKAMHNARHGAVQLIHRLALLPEYVRDAYYANINGDEDSPRIKDSDVTELCTMFRKNPMDKEGLKEAFEQKAELFGQAGDDSQKPVNIGQMDDALNMVESYGLRGAIMRLRFRDCQFDLSAYDAQLVVLEEKGTIDEPELKAAVEEKAKFLAEKAAEKAAKEAERAAKKAAKEAKAIDAEDSDDESEKSEKKA